MIKNQIFFKLNSEGAEMKNCSAGFLLIKAKRDYEKKSIYIKC